MKKFLSWLLVLIMSFSLLASCGQDEIAPETADVANGDAEEYTLEREDGCNQITFYWHADGVDYSKCDMWIWYPDADGRGYLFHECEYGAKVVLNVPESIEKVGFIVRRDCSDPGGTSWGDATKDYDGDRYAAITGPDTFIYLKEGDAAQYLSLDGGKTLYQEKNFKSAGIVALDKIKYIIEPAARIESLGDVKVKEGDREIEIAFLSSLNNNVTMGTITLSEALDITKTYTVSIEGYGERAAVPTEVFDSAEFVEKYTYDGDDLGAVTSGLETTFRLWAPTASAVKVKLFNEGDGVAAYDTIDMEKSNSGTWVATVPCGSGTYYTYEVTTADGTKEAVDPYAKAVGVNGNRGMVINLDTTDPAGFENDKYYDGIDSYNDAVIWEVHVRDFSNKIISSKYPGKYLAFTEHGLTNESGEVVGIDYLVDLGITHVHLQPVYDYATVDESSDAPQFNWGYDPKNYNAPEGSYSTDPYHGEVRIKEFKEMVMALHNAGIGVIMDVVYNHTYDIDSALGRTVPYYYYRYNGLSEASNGSGCGNETASERVMFRKYMVDSVKYWATEYHLDGFRFDLMALHDVDTMQAIESALHTINPKAVIYGEGWTGGTTTLNTNSQANQANIKNVVPTGDAIGAVAVFNDAIRDGLKGSVFDEKDTGYINGTTSKLCAEKVAFGIAGGEKTSAVSWSVEDCGVINYMACHDNHTIWDKLLKSNPDASDDERLLMNRLGASIVLTSKGVPFFLAGEEMLRTKGGDHNSYASSDEVNNIKWDALTTGSDVMKMRDFYRGLIAMRKANAFFTEADVSCTIESDGTMTVTWSVDGAVAAYGIINPNEAPCDAALPDGEWGILLDGWSARTAPDTRASGNITVEGKSFTILVK